MQSGYDDAAPAFVFLDEPFFEKADAEMVH
jgi:hypothetical protein